MSGSTLAKAELGRARKKEKPENLNKKDPNEDTKLLLTQLKEELHLEKFDERRVNLLKSQVIQLERQILLLSENISQRSNSTSEAEESFNFIVKTCRRLLGQEVKGPTVPVERKELVKLIEVAESSRLGLCRQGDTRYSTLSKPLSPLLYTNNALIRHKGPPKEEHSVTLLDVCSGDTGHLNLREVGKLESSLARLRAQLVGTRASLGTLLGPEVRSLLGQPSQQHLLRQLDACQALLEHSCGDLLALSLLVPAAPWPAINRPVVGHLKTAQVMAKMPKMAAAKHQQVVQVVEGMSRASHYHLHLVQLEKEALEAELGFHQAFHALQVQYVQSLFQAITTKYGEFEKDLVKLVCHPLSGILQAFQDLKGSASQEALRLLLTTFKENAEQLQNTVQVLTPAQGSTSAAAISEYGQQFFSSLEALADDLAKKRDKLAQEIDLIKTQMKN